MKNKKFFLLTVLIIVVAIIIGILIFQKPSMHKDSEEIHVAMNLPITGPFGIYGQTIRDGSLLAISELTTQNSKRRILLDIQDNAGEPKNAVSVYEKQILSKIDIYVSGVKPQTMAIFDRVVERGFPYFVWIFDAFVVDRYPNVFRSWVNYKYEPEKYIQYIRFRRAKRVAIACVNMPHTVQEFNEIIIPRLNKENVKTVIEIYEWNLKEYRNLIQKLSSKNPDLYILNGFQENLVGLVKALRTYNLIENGNTIGTYDLLDAANLLTKDELEGLRVIAPEFNIATNQNLNDWKSKFKEKYKRDALYTDAYAYDMIMIIADASKRIKFPTNSENWIKVLSDTNFDGITGRLSFDKGGDLILQLKICYYTEGILKLDPIEGDKK
jgi:ABC-type branched-subunit amino acid transport system substrate-binding protein